MGDSPVWTDLLKIKPIYLRGRQVIIKNGKHTLFWKDSWPGDKPICVQAPVLFDWCEDKDINVYQFLSKNGQLRFSRWLPQCCLNVGLTSSTKHSLLGMRIAMILLNGSGEAEVISLLNLYMII
jgi:hypothetical protein